MFLIIDKVRFWSFFLLLVLLHILHCTRMLVAVLLQFCIMSFCSLSLLRMISWFGYFFLLMLFSDEWICCGNLFSRTGWFELQGTYIQLLLGYLICFRLSLLSLLFFSILKMPDLFSMIFILFIFHQLSMICIAVFVSSMFDQIQITSSENVRHSLLFVCIWISRSFRNRINKYGDNTGPCMSPLCVLKISSPIIRVNLFNIFWISFTMFQGTLISNSFCRSWFLGTES